MNNPKIQMRKGLCRIGAGSQPTGPLGLRYRTAGAPPGLALRVSQPRFAAGGRRACRGRACLPASHLEAPVGRRRVGSADAELAAAPRARYNSSRRCRGAGAATALWRRGELPTIEHGPMDALIFDFDGVVVDSEPIHMEGFQRVLRAIGVELTE